MDNKISNIIFNEIKAKYKGMSISDLQTVIITTDYLKVFLNELQTENKELKNVIDVFLKFF